MAIIKKIIKTMCLLAVVTLAGCSNQLAEDELLLPGKNLVRITVANNLTTRAARPIGNSNAANNVNHVQLVVYKKGTTDTTWEKDNSVEFATEAGTEISDGLLTWASSGDDGNAWNVSHDVTQTVYLKNLTAGTQYRIVGYGYNGETEPFVKEVNNGSFTTTSFPVVQEVFAGSIEPMTNAEGSFDEAQTLTLERQVAGMLARFKNVPAVWNGKNVDKVIVKANQKAANIFFPQNGEDNIFNGTDMATGSGFPLLTFNVSEIKTGTKKLNNNNGSKEVYTFNAVNNGTVDDNGIGPFAEEYTAVHPGLELDGSEIFGACFILPYDKHYYTQTLWIELQDADGAVLQKWNVNVKSGQTPTGGSMTVYDIRRNHFYSIDDIDLSKANNVIVIVDDRWDGVHELTPSVPE